MSITRSLKRGNVRQFDESYHKGYQDAWASEVDADFNILFDSWNNGIPGGIALADGSVTNAKLGDNSVTSEKILDGTIQSNDIGDGEISRVKLSPVDVLPSLPPLPQPADVNKVVAVNAAGNALEYVAAPPPIGPAGGDLTGNYPNPTIAPGVTLPPSGPAGGDLTGTYPNPTIGPLAVGNAEVSDLAYSKLTGAPTSLPPSGSAGGDLAGIYPDPTIGTGKVTTAKILDANVTAAKLAADAKPWTVTGATLAPTDTTKNVIAVGPITSKGRILTHPTLAATYVTENATLNAGGTGWVQDDAAKPTLVFHLDAAADAVSVRRGAPGTTAAGVIMSVLATGDFTITGATATKASGTAWANPSDIRIKRSVTDYKIGLDAIMQLRPVRFEYNGLAGTVEGQVGYGYMADDVKCVMPEMVSTIRKKLREEDEEEVDLQLLDPSNVILALVNSIRELTARIGVLEGK